MANTPSITTAARSVAADAVMDLLDAGNEDPQLRIYGGTPPDDVNAALGQHATNTQLAALAMDATAAFGAASSGVATAAAIDDDISADATGTATFFRCGSMNSGTFTPVFQGTVGTSGCDLNLSSTSIISGGTISISSLTYTQNGS